MSQEIKTDCELPNRRLYITTSKTEGHIKLRYAIREIADRMCSAEMPAGTGELIGKHFWDLG